MDPNKKEELIKKLEAANAHKAELDARKKDMIERGAVVNKGLKEVDKQQSKKHFSEIILTSKQWFVAMFSK